MRILILTKNILYIIKSQIAEEASGKTWDTTSDGVMRHIALNIRMDLLDRIHRPILDNIFIQVDEDLLNLRLVYQ
jgi:hypothetical protein